MVKVERRQSRRTDVDVIISLKKLDESRISACSGETVDVNVINISKGGIAFKSDRKFELNTYYSTVITLDNKERIEAVVEIIRMENLGEAETTYGCRFVGISEKDQFRIEVHQLVYESNHN